MRKLDILIATAATALGESEASVRSMWQQLRRAGLWTKVGPGHPMPDPSPEDVANLLLAFLSGATPSRPGEIVGIVRGSRHDPGNVLKSVQRLVPALAPLGQDHTLAEMLTVLIGGWRCADVVMGLSVRQSWRGWITTFTVEELADQGDVTLVGYSVESEHSKIVTSPRPVADAVTDRRITHTTLGALASVLGGDTSAATAMLSEKSYRRVRLTKEEAVLAKFQPGLDIYNAVKTVLEPEKGSKRRAARGERRRRR